MDTIVQKFGGTSVATIDRFRQAAQRVSEQVALGNQVIVVVSAMAGDTNRLIEYTQQFSLLPDAAEYDVVTSAGEQVSCGLFALALHEKGIPARSLLSWQIPMETCNTHSQARYQKVLAHKIHEELNHGVVVVIPGFQGISPEGRLTTLGRGGSDITAVAAAAAIGADRCDIFTDVAGVYTADPRIVLSARRLKEISYEEMMELSSQGAKVIQNRAVTLAMNQNVPLRILSTFENSEGTWIVSEEKIMEKGKVRGITHSVDDVYITLKGVLDQPGTGAKIFSPLAQGNIPIDMIAHQTNGAERNDLSFTVPRNDLDRMRGILTSSQETIDFETIQINDQVAKITVVGSGLRNHPLITSQAFETLANMGVNIYKTATSEIKLSFLIPQEYAELAVRALHKAYKLED